MDEPIVIVACPSCGSMPVSFKDVTVRVCLDDDIWAYRFLCTGCGTLREAPTWSFLALELMMAGSVCQTWHADGDPGDVDQGSKA